MPVLRQATRRISLPDRTHMKEPLPERRCLFCDDPFIPKTTVQLYDTTDCRFRAARQRKYDERMAERAAAEAATAAQ